MTRAAKRKRRREENDPGGAKIKTNIILLENNNNAKSGAPHFARLSGMPQHVKDAAEFYAARFGWRVFPLYEIAESGVCSCNKGAECKTPGKHPRVSIPSGEGAIHPSTTDQKTISVWWKKWSNANIGVWLEGANTIVLDIDKNDKKDGFKGLSDIMAHAGEEFLPKTLICDTPSGGKHLYFNFVEGVPNKSNSLGPGLDTWHTKHYVIVPPSNHEKGIYQWATQDDPIDYPEWLKPQEKAKRSVGRPSKEKLDPQNDDDVASLLHALKHIDSSDRDRWVMVGFALARLFQWSDEGFDVYNKWAETADNYDPKKTKEQYYKQSKVVPKIPITTGSIFEWAKEHPGYTKLPKLTERDHYELAVATKEGMTLHSGWAPVASLGSLWQVGADGIWLPHTRGQLSVAIAAKFRGHRYCKRKSDFEAIADVVMNLCEDDSFFEPATIGVACPSGFFRVTENGDIIKEPLSPEHRQRLRLKVDPDSNSTPERFLSMLRDAFDTDSEAQVKLVQQLFGCAITRTLFKHRTVGLFLGETSTGKSTALAVLRAVFPPDGVSAASPAKWDDKNVIAGLAGMALNIVGELDAKDPIPAGAFKAITGRDSVQGRHPYGRFFTFVCQAAHFFNANKTPPTTDHSDAFFRRWRIVYFGNPVPEDRQVIDLDDLIIKHELGSFIWWALNGAAEVVRDAKIIETKTHREKLAEWRSANNSAMAFINDPTQCLLSPVAQTAGQAAYNSYQTWALNNGFKTLGRTGFYDSIKAGARHLGLAVRDQHNQVSFVGVGLVKRPWKTQ